MERLESFVAGALLQRLRRADPDDRAAAHTSFRGAALFVDISQYTVLAEALCEQGPSGIETLGGILDRAFRSHVHEVHETGGEIACFAGDAFIAYWPADDGSVPRELRRANECARRLHAAAKADEQSARHATPLLHIGLGAGDMWAARLGGGDRWQLLLAGPAVRDACAAAVRAAAGETIVAPAAGPLLPSIDLVDDTDRSLIRAAAPAAADVASHVPRRVVDYLRSGYSAWIAEWRTICALFVRIDGLDVAAADSLTRHQAVVTSLHTALRPYTGSPGTLLLDDKGMVFTLCLGMPGDAHADDALRAVRAGLAIRSELTRIGIGCSVGVAGGEGICMALGGPERHHYWAVGRFMHVAGRLMEAAGRGMLCTEDIADRVRRVVALSPERPLALKGVRAPLRPYRVREAAAHERDDDRLFGREDEQAMLNRHLDRFEAGGGAVLWIEGEPGLGKSALVGHLRRAAAERACRCFVGGAASVDIDVPYGAWRPVFAALLEKPAASASDAERRQQLGAVRYAQLAPLVNAVVPGFLEETPIVRSLSGQARADATSSLLSEIVGSHATSRFVLVIEDCHWMDSASWRLLLRVTQDYPQALIVLTSRPGTGAQELSVLRKQERFVEVALKKLDRQAIESVIEAVLGGRSGAGVPVGEIVDRAGGNPLFAREFALLRSTYGLERDYSAPATDGRPNPTAELEYLIAERLDTLPPAAALALKTASVIGDAFSIDLLARARTEDARGEALDALLLALAEQQLIVRLDHDEAAWKFQHALIRDATYKKLTGGQHRTLHQRVAEAIEGTYDVNLSPHFASLAHHWEKAGAADPAIKYHDLAATQALAAGAFAEADRLLGSCVRLAKDRTPARDVVTRWHRQIADARHGLGQLEPRSAAARVALRVAGQSRPQNAVGLLVVAGGRLLDLSLRASRPPRPMRAEDAARTLDIARAFRHSGEVCYFNNDIVGMICDCLSAVSFASRVPPSAVLAGASTELGGILSVAGLRRVGERILQRATDVAEDAGDQPAQAYAHMIRCLYHVGRGDWESAEDSAKRCQDLADPMDDRVNWTNAQAVRFWMSHYRSRYDGAHEAARKLQERAGQTGNAQHRAWALRFLGLCAMRAPSPDYRDAVAKLREARDCLDETAALNERIPTLSLLALAQLRDETASTKAQARVTATESLALIARVGRPIGHSTLEGYSSLLTVALDAWHEERTAEWRRAIATCLQVLDRYRKGFPIGEARYHLHLGDYRRMAGAVRAARRAYQRGEAAAARLGMPWEAARCRSALDALSASH